MPPGGNTPRHTGAIERLLRDHLRTEAHAREESVAKFVASLGVCCTALAAASGPTAGWDIATALMSVLAAATSYYFVLYRALSRGWFRPWIQKANVALEVSIPAFIFLVETLLGHTEQALSSPVNLGWGIMIMLSALRSQPRLAIGAGALAAAEFLALYFTLMRPQLSETPFITFSPIYALFRAFFLFATGLATSMVAGYLVEKAREVISAVRARDLMGKYVLHERIGVGGMAEVYRGTYSPEGGFEKQVAVKRILPAFANDREFVNLFRQEAELCSSLNHPNIVQVFDMGRFEETYFLAMEFVEGMSLHILLKARAVGLPAQAVAYVGAELASALEYLHGRTDTEGAPLRLVHRDVNPPNVLVSHIGEVKLGDFGVARSHIGAAVTLPGSVRGKAGYMAPEQARGQEIDGRADLFAVGLTLHESLTGAALLQGASDLERMRASFEQNLAPPSTYRADVPPELDAIIMGLLEREVGQRIQSASELRARLLALPAAVAPYPYGRSVLVTAMAQARRPPQEGKADDFLQTTKASPHASAHLNERRRLSGGE